MPYFLKTRYYDPEIGRFITIDDISYLDPETINGLNLYAYCGNNPVMRTDQSGTKPNVSIGVDIWNLCIYEGAIWKSGRYQLKRTFKVGKNIFCHLGNNLLYIGEKILNIFELKFGKYHLSALAFSDSGFTLISAGFELFKINAYAGTDYIGVTIGSLNLSFLDINFQEYKFNLIDAQATALTFGAYTEYVDAEILVGSIGATIKLSDGALTIGGSFGWGIKITIRFW